MSSNGGNVTNTSFSSAIIAGHGTIQWTFTPIFSCALLIVVFVTNVPVLVQLVRKRELRTSFSIYLMHLLSVNILHTISRNSVDMLTYGRWSFSPAVNYQICTLRIYCNYMLGAGILLTHVLITFNRIWAVTFPSSYRVKHTMKTALLTCFCGWVYLHLLLLPGIIPDALYYRRHTDLLRCTINNSAQPIWAKVSHIVGYVLPIPVMILSLPYVSYRVFKRQRERAIIGHTTYRSEGQPTRQINTDLSSSSNKRNTGKSWSKNNVRPLLILAMLTLSVLGTWLPGRVSNALALFMGYNNDVFAQAGYVLFAVQVVIDPFILIVGFKELRISCR